MLFHGGGVRHGYNLPVLQVAAGTIDDDARLIPSTQHDELHCTRTLHAHNTLGCRRRKRGLVVWEHFVEL